MHNFVICPAETHYIASIIIGFIYVDTAHVKYSFNYLIHLFKCFLQVINILKIIKKLKFFLNSKKKDSYSGTICI